MGNKQPGLRLSEFDSKCNDLCERHGYKLLFRADGKVQIISKGIPGFSGDEIQSDLYRSAFSAVERLIPICGEEFGDDYRKTFPEQLVDAFKKKSSQ